MQEHPAAGMAGLLVTDRIVLALPTEARFRSVATLVLGGIGSRADLPYERMDDLQLAVLSALDAADQAEVTFEVDADENGVSLALGPVRDGSGDDQGLGLVLSRLVDDVTHERRDGAEWLSLRLSRAGGAA
jgi:anti-sigma regulatory factor (Ser/Thr protein kinase)